MNKKRRGRYARTAKTAGMPIWAVVVIDILLVGVILLTFAFFHHVLPAMVSEYQRQQELLNATQPPVTLPPETAPAQTAEPTQSATEAEETVPETTALPDNRTEWQIKFEEHFSEEVIQTENSYKSPNVSITVETITTGEGNRKVTYHVADIYIASIENFTTYTANNEMRFFGTQDILEMDAASNALLAISGDFLTYQQGGFLMRNGELYASNSNYNSICVLYADGTMETYDKRQYVIDDIIADGAVQVWSFGPPLLDENGKAATRFDVPTAVSYPNPRSAIGYYEPGHYCFVVVDGRQDGYSRGMEIPELAAVFEELGCKLAYNLDGGGSAVMTFNHERYSQQSNGSRALGDILVIRESAALTAEQEDAQ